MDKTVDITIPVEPEVAATLQDASRREAVGRIVSRLLRPKAGTDPLIEAILRLKNDAHERGLSDAIVEAELAAYNSERRT